MQRYFLEEPYQQKDRFVLVGEPYHHITRVMRMMPENRVYLAFSDQVAIIAEITAITENEVELKEVMKEQGQKELPSMITIASGYPKGEKLDWIVQKGTELGAHAFLGFPAKTSVVKWDEKKRNKRQQRLAKIAQEAAEQAHRQVVPQVELLSTASEFYQQISSYDKVLVAYEESAKRGELANLAQALQKSGSGLRILAIFGPEGGLTTDEVEKLSAEGAVICGLGPRILRTETAPLYLLSAASYQWELLGEQDGK
ncbi:16S rRNA (uracil(1498)-N(3))-methyltransferase [Enterococcus thailandicus]|uniref:16S rRNA (uracil(1498)-N(3))-methyltransferase n=1 Tax=Enterococcus TaxID=1350 RepID=UPI000A339214|nr:MULTISPECIES: 16S rRNA (uracil(1498)-N(3))-methyltransferase [Enterococcus]MDT2752609.1 16S rRNA (uracil(1498)-N(3))-methyltransferase [Enterococcus thailandicus]MDT2776191.1 16S rRNA (uracil(1498)-N(3))-methyltransferase [Enterococcus thailandicus]MDT2795389.1 16S rRNA (uracil(1498)-N(3))-methyltransferase [Enterococcus thailandicus]MDT2846775.1 16S rRNA (uracil(1498)-N(3))-methyltransferase [Enterococcus thailandicus]OTP23191.1 16S ribosomal RNA methyltransferase RsmE [Enterococcus sp. 5B